VCAPSGKRRALASFDRVRLLAWQHGRGSQAAFTTAMSVEHIVTGLAGYGTGCSAVTSWR
jgi:hypothetical protein